MTSFKRLTRGIKLLREHIFDPINSTLDLLTKAGLPIDNYNKENGTFRVTLTFPYSRCSLVQEGETSAPFILPPLQEFFDKSEYLIEGYELIELSVGQDTRCEPGYLRPPQSVVADPGPQAGVVLGAAPSFSVFIRDHKIDASNFDPFSNEVYSVTIPEISLINDYSRLNPFVQSGMAIPFRHDRTYIVQLIPETDNRAMVSVTISLKFKTRLVGRDGTAAAENNTLDAGHNFVPLGATVPAGNTPIESDSADGINTGFKILDDFIGRKLAGGYSRSGQNQYAEGLREDAGYEVIAVPMFGGWGGVFGGPAPYGAGVGGVDYQAPDALPWSTTGVGGLQTMDRALIPIQYPISIHHVILAVNNTPITGGLDYWRLGTGVLPNGTDCRNEVGIGLLSGIRSDNVAISQIAHNSWLPADLAAGTNVIDRGDWFRENTTGRTRGYSWDILSCPLQVGTLGAGTGYSPQGKPVFVAQGASDTLPRTGPLGPIVAGVEQMLDIRWKISDSVTDVSTWAENNCIIGYRGHWVYLICKKMLR